MKSIAQSGVALVLAVGLMVLAVPILSAAPVSGADQVKCYDAFGNEIILPPPAKPLPDRSADFSVNRPSYTKLDANGGDLPGSATSWAMVRDNASGLIWEVKQNKDGQKNYENPHDADNVYTWYNPADSHPGGSGEGRNTKDFLDALNRARFGGYSDWRLPTVKELACLVRYETAHPGPTIDTRYFPNTMSSVYWSSTGSAGYPEYAWLVDFYKGAVYDGDKIYGNFVRAVRGAP
jgi:hypothetical protein